MKTNCLFMLIVSIFLLGCGKSKQISLLESCCEFGEISVIEEDYEVYIPNIFSPDGNNNNDELIIQINGDIVSIVSFDIWNQDDERLLAIQDVPLSSTHNSWEAWNGASPDGIIKKEICNYSLVLMTVDDELVEISSSILVHPFIEGDECMFTTDCCSFPNQMFPDGFDFRFDHNERCL